ncbi:MAG: glycosyltransferase family 2 protein [Candidatus Heimdallarchaeaceae archaeon]
MSLSYFIEKTLVIIPVWNNEEIFELIKKFRKKIVNEIVIVLDEAKAKTEKKILLIAQKISTKVTILKNQKRMGIGYGIRKGLFYGLKNHYEYAVVMAGNGKDNPLEIPILLEKLMDGYDYVQGSRYLCGGKYKGMPLFRYLITKSWPIFWTILCRRKVTEVTNGFRAYKLSIINDPKVNLEQEWLDGYALEYYIHYKVLTSNKYKYAEVPVSKIYKSKKNYTKINPFKDWKQIALPPILLFLRIKK